MIGLFRIIIIFAIIYFVLRFITRVLLPLFVGNYINQKVSQTQNNSKNENSRRREGDITINYSSKNDKKYKGNDGDYVDFEEIKE